VEPPSVGSDRDENGAMRPVAFVPYRINGQFIIEGLSSGLLFVLGGVGFIILDKVNRKNTEDRNRYIMLASGAACILLAYNLAVIFLRMKLPGYMR